MKPGDILIPAKYLNKREPMVTGIILEVVDDLWGPNHRVLLSSGIVKWFDGPTIRNLWEVAP